MLILHFLFLGFVSSKQASNDAFRCGQCRCFTSMGVMSADCSGRKLSLVPQDLPTAIVKLNLGNNTISSLDDSLQSYGSLLELDLSNNKVSGFHEDNFANLHNLTTLNISNNHVPLTSASYPQALFRHQQKLSDLDLHHNCKLYGKQFDYPHQALGELKSLNYLRIDGLRNPMFGPGFQKLVNLQTLWLTGFCDIRTLSNGTFKYLSSVRYLILRQCEITYIEPKAFEPLIHIQIVDLDLNTNLGIRNLGRGLYGLQNSTAKILRARRLHPQHGPGIVLRSVDMQYLRNTQLEEISIDENRIEFLDADALSYMPPTLKRISGRDNIFLFGFYLFTAPQVTSLEWADFSKLDKSHAQPFRVQTWESAQVQTNTLVEPQLERLPCASESSLNNYHFAESLQGVNDPWPGNFTLPMPPNVTFANVSNSKLHFTISRIQLGPNKLKVLDFSYNFFTRWIGPVIGLDHLEFMDLSHNYCDFMDDTTPRLFPSLKILNLSSNFLGYTLTNKTFHQMDTLEHLDLSNNKIKQLPQGIFANLKSLQHLDLSLNYMTTWDTPVEHMINLSYLDLSNNMFEAIPQNLEMQLSGIRHEGLSVNMENNPLKCTCETLPTIQWMEENGNRIVNFNRLKCTMINGVEQNMTYLHDIVYDLEKRCASYVGIMIGILSIVLLFLSLCIMGLTYRYRWKLRYLYYLTMNRHRGYLSVQDEEHNFEFDAFISYADEDRGFVVRDMRNILEEAEEEEERFRLCIHHRDFLPGEAIAANILKAINTSRKTVVILTRNFLKSYWCRYEVEMAKMESIYRGRNTLLIVVMEDIPVKDLPVDIVEVMRKDSYVEFTNDREGQEVFWRNIKRAICN